MKRLVSLILALCMLLSAGFVLASCAVEKESEKASSSDKVSMSTFVKKLGYLDEKGELDDFEVLEGDAASRAIDGAVYYVEAESEDGEGFWAVEFKEESRAKEFYEEAKAEAEEDDEGVTFKRSGKLVYAYSDKAFYDRIMAAKAPSGQTPGGSTDKPGSSTDKPGSSTDKPGSSTDKPGSSTDKPSEPTWSTNEELVALKLSANSIKNFLGQIKGEYVRPSETLGDALSQVNLSAEYDGTYVSMKDGYLAVDSQGNRYVHAIKDNYGVSIENGELYDWEKLFEEPSETEFAEFCDNFASVIDDVLEIGYIPELSSSDVVYYEGWYEISADFTREWIIGAMKTSVVTAGTDPDAMTEEEKEMLEQVEKQMREILNYVSVGVSFSVDNDSINGMRLYVESSDLYNVWYALYGSENGMVSGSVLYDTEIILGSDRTLARVETYSSVDIRYEDSYETAYVNGNANLCYAGNQLTFSGYLNYENSWSVYTEGFSVTINSMNVNFDDEMTPTYLYVDGRAGITEMSYRELVQTVYIDIDNDGYEESIEMYIPVYADAEYDFDLELDLEAMKDSGRAIDATLGINIKNARIYTEEIYHFPAYSEKNGYMDYEMTAGDAYWYFSDDAINSAFNTYNSCGNIRVDLYTEKGRGELYVEQDFPNDYQSIYVQVEVNGYNPKAATEAEKEAIQSFRPEDHYEDPAPIEPNPVVPNPDVPNQGKASYEKLAYETLPEIAEEYGRKVNYVGEGIVDGILVKDRAVLGDHQDFYLAVWTFYDKESAKAWFDIEYDFIWDNGYDWGLEFSDEYTLIFGSSYLVDDLIQRGIENQPDYSYTYVDSALALVAGNYGTNVVYYSSAASGIVSGQYILVGSSEVSVDYYENESLAQEFATAYEYTYGSGYKVCYVQGNRVVYGDVNLVKEVMENSSKLEGVKDGYYFI